MKVTLESLVRILSTSEPIIISRATFLEGAEDKLVYKLTDRRGEFVYWDAGKKEIWVYIRLGVPAVSNQWKELLNDILKQNVSAAGRVGGAIDKALLSKNLSG